MNNLDEFLKELDGRGFNFMDKTFDEFGFKDEILNMVYEMYQAGVDSCDLEIAQEKSKKNIWRDERNHAIKRWNDISKENKDLKQKLSKYENTDYVLVPRNPTEKMIWFGESGIAVCQKIKAQDVYKDMLEALEG